MIFRQSFACFLASSAFLSPNTGARAFSPSVLSHNGKVAANQCRFIPKSLRKRRITKGIFPLRCVSLASHNDNIATLSTQADITETIRLHSHDEMSKLLDAASDGTPLPTLLTTSESVSQYIDEHIDAILFDCDGVLYRGTDPIPNAAAALSSLVDRQKKIFFVTNNAGSNRKQLRDKLANLLHMESLTKEQMVTSSYSAARYLQRELLNENGTKSTNQNIEREQQKHRVHVIGTSGLCSEIASAGFTVQGGPSDDSRAGMTRAELAAYPFSDKPIDAFVVGLDEEFNYRKLCIANVLMQRNPQALFVATNEDAYDLVGADARHLPGNGALVKALEHCSGRKSVCVGKPSPLLAELISDDHGLDASRTLFVGDRLDTDVRFGVESGMQSALVMTGCTTAEKVTKLCLGTSGKGSVEEPMPTIIFPHMGMMAVDGHD